MRKKINGNQKRVCADVNNKRERARGRLPVALRRGAVVTSTLNLNTTQSRTCFACVCVCVRALPACHRASDTQNSLPSFSLEQHKEICVTMPTDQSARLPLPPPSSSTPNNPFWLPFPASPTPRTTDIFNKCHKCPDDSRFKRVLAAVVSRV